MSAQTEIYKKTLENIRLGMITMLDILKTFPEKAEEASIIFTKVTSLSTMICLDLQESKGILESKPLFEEEMISVGNEVVDFIIKATEERDQIYRNSLDKYFRP